MKGLVRAAFIICVLFGPSSIRPEPDAPRRVERCASTVTLWAVEPIGFQNVVGIVNYIDDECSFRYSYLCAEYIWVQPNGEIDYTCKAF